MQKIFIVSALPYCNNIPHLGNIIGSTLSGDVYARFEKLVGNDVLYLCGVDEYGTTTEVKAFQEKTTCEDICQKYGKLHKEIYDWFNINFDIWGRTATETQTKLTQEIFINLYKNGYIEEKASQQMYCSSCNRFLADRYLKGICYHKECKNKNSITNGDQCDTCGNFIDVDKIIDPKCYICHTTPYLKETHHLYLKLGDFTDKIKTYFNNPNVSLTPNAASITKSWLDKGLTSRCITRDLKWGTPVPFEFDDKLSKYKDKVFYVWWDACIGYFSILAHTCPDWKNWICDKNVKFVQLQAKDNVQFHTIIFIATLFGDGDRYNSLTHLNATEYLQYEGTKFSKSNNIGVFGDQVVNISKELGIDEDYWRHYLIKIRPEKHDTSFSWEEFCNTCTADLVKNYGNYINRCISMTDKYSKNKTFKLDLTPFNEECLIINKYIDQYVNHMSKIELKDGINIPYIISDIGNNFLHKYTPWNYKNDIDNPILQNILSFALLIAHICSVLLEPFIPKSANKIKSYIKVDMSDLLVNKNIMSYHDKQIILDDLDYTLLFKPLNYKEILPILQKLNIYFKQ